jgi:putative Flp pilus-assembly TadE/G-like protein
MLGRSSQRGQALPFIAVFLFGLLAMCALTIDVASWYQGKRATQNSADAAALAGAAFLGVDWPTARSHATSEFTKNKATGDTATYTQTTTFVPNDTIQVTVTRSAPTYFAKLFGKSNVTIVSTSRAAVTIKGGGALPWAVMNNTYTPGTSYPIYTDNSGPNNGAVRLPAWDTASAQCTTGTVNGLGGSSLYQAQVTGGIVSTCLISIGQVIDTKTGNNTGPTSAGIDARCSSLQSPTAIATFGNPVALLQPDSCQVMLLPVVINAQDLSNNWPGQGSGQVQVVGFSWWILKDYAAGGKIVDAVYLGPAPTDPNASGTLPPPYSPQLTG